MEEINRSLFLMFNASAAPSAAALFIAKFFATYVIWIFPALLLAGWLRGNKTVREWMLEAAVAGLLGLLINQMIGLLWQHPRPFMIGLGHTLISHVADSSFPSDHLTLIWALAFSFMLHPALRASGALLALCGIPVALARIYLGVHFPIDMVGAAMVAAGSAWLCNRMSPHFISPLYNTAIILHRFLLKPLIRLGWIAD